METDSISLKNNTTSRKKLQDAKKPFEVWTDYKNLKYFREPHKLNG